MEAGRRAHRSHRLLCRTEPSSSSRSEEEQFVSMQEEIFRFDRTEVLDLLNRRTNSVPLIAIQPARTLRGAPPRLPRRRPEIRKRIHRWAAYSASGTSRSRQILRASSIDLVMAYRGAQRWCGGLLTQIAILSAISSKSTCGTLTVRLPCDSLEIRTRPCRSKILISSWTFLKSRLTIFASS